MKRPVSRYDDLLAAAELLFRSKGYSATSMSDVAEACHLEKAAIYYHFSSKEQLAIAVMTKVQTYFDRSIFIHAYNEALSPRVRLSKMNKMVERYFSVGNAGCLFASFAIEQIDAIPAFITPIRHYFDSWSQAYQNIFSEAYDVEAAKALADSFVSDLQGALIMTRVTQDSDYLRRLLKRLTQALPSRRSLKKGHGY
jgi:TetR/AcrR family transcriptional regulator, transcriptional repressor for nem operon